jgi:hypothetical protein
MCLERLSHNEEGFFILFMSVKVIRRQTNKAADILAKAATYIVNSRVLVDVLNCIEHLLITKCYEFVLFSINHIKK